MSLPPCPACHEAVGGPICVGCGLLQPVPAALDPWTALGLRPRWALEPADIDRAWKERSKLVHPDRFVGKAPALRRAALGWTAGVNEARRALKAPMSRGLWLAIGQGALPERGGPVMAPDFLDWVFSMPMAPDDDPTAVGAAVTERRAALYTDLQTLFSAWEQAGSPPPGHPSLAAAPALLAQLRYVEQLQARLEPTPA